MSVSCAEYLFDGSAGRPASSEISKKRQRKTIVDSSAERDGRRNARPCSSKQVLIDSSAGRPARSSETRQRHGRHVAIQKRTRRTSREKPRFAGAAENAAQSMDKW